MSDNLNTPGNRSVGHHIGVALSDIKKTRPLRVLSKAQFRHWQEKGYVVIPNAVSASDVKDTVDFLWEFQEMSPSNPDSWYAPQRLAHAMTELNNSGMVEAYHHQVLWNNRQAQRVYDSFVDIWDKEALWVTIDRANLNPPNRAGREFSGFIHWDSDTSQTPLPISVQGVLALSDTDEETGGFQCVPELYRDLAVWRESQPLDRNPFKPDLTGYQAESVPMKAGDLLIFNGLLPHGIRPNTSNRVRLAQYISMSPAMADDSVRDWRLDCFEQKSTPMGYAFPGDPRKWEREKYTAATLTTLGERLLGRRPWGFVS
ncbi:phytanoyl-CoA dioxygenase family protein [Marinomonas sp. RSW2]|uniref:Phytanoyl-CoA dioxygenase family protein n=1 Tax=Marinomonas maritima TaxID=2940935 RepID=A0ABT5WDV4_9GAMM|nr:phytanoyl-CoA dioxygenase family protein [Marinomonas maritima]MDE8603007.1 phytanoyl-CoA dioxygenase family protein [Marinomonas maritima]